MVSGRFSEIAVSLPYRIGPVIIGGGVVYLYSRIILTIAGICIASGGLYDVLTPRLPSNLAATCSSNEAAAKVMRELLRALGACLVAIGATVATMATSMDLRQD